MWTRPIALLAAVLALAPASVTAGEPSASDLIALAPVISSSDPKYRSIEISGYVEQDDFVRLNFRAVYRAPDQYALMLSDRADGTPLWFAAGRNVFIYDPLDPAVIYGTDGDSNLSISQEGDAFKFSWGWWWDKTEPNKILLDVQSLFRGPKKEDKVVKTGDRKYRLTRTSEKGTFLVSHIDLTSTHPYTNIEIIKLNKNKPVFCIKTLKINEAIKDEAFEIPAKDRLSEKIKVRDWSEYGLLKYCSGSELMLRAGYVRLGANQPETRKWVNQSINPPELLGIDWDKVQENDKKFSRVLRELVPSGYKTP